MRFIGELPVQYLRAFESIDVPPSAIRVSRHFILRASNSSAAERVVVVPEKKTKDKTKRKRKIVKFLGLHFKNGDAISAKELPVG